MLSRRHAGEARETNWQKQQQQMLYEDSFSKLLIYRITNIRSLLANMAHAQKKKSFTNAHRNIDPKLYSHSGVAMTWSQVGVLDNYKCITLKSLYTVS